MGRKFNIGMSIVLEYMSIACLFWLNGDRAVSSFFILHSISSILFGCNIRYFLMFCKDNKSIMGGILSSVLVFFTPVVTLLGVLALLDFLFGSDSSEDNKGFLGSGFPLVLEKSGETFSERIPDFGNMAGSTIYKAYCADQKIKQNKQTLHDREKNKSIYSMSKGGDQENPLSTGTQIETAGSHLIQINRFEHPFSDLSPSGLPSSIIRALSISNHKEKKNMADKEIHDRWTNVLQETAVALSHQNNAQVLLLIHRMRLYLKQNGYSESALGKDLVKEIPKKLLNPILEELSFQKKQFDNVMRMMGALEAKLRP